MVGINADKLNLKNILYITTNIGNSGGVARVLSVKLNYLVKEFGYKIHILNTYGSTNSNFYHFDDSIKFHYLKRKKNGVLGIFSYKKRLNKDINLIAPEIIVNTDNGLKGAMFPYFYKGNTPVIFESHSSKNAIDNGLLRNLKLKFKKYIFSKTVKSYLKIIVLNYIQKEWKSNNIIEIQNPLTFNSPKLSAELEKKIVIAVGRISYQKGYDLLLKIWKIVAYKHPDWTLHIYGEGNAKSYEGNVKSQSINNVNFLKPVKNIKEVYLNASILLNTSRYEPFGLANIEAMACGLPVLAFNNILGPKSYIEHNQNGFLITEGDILEYANKIGYLIDNKSERKRIGKNAVESVKNFDLDTIMLQWHDLFQEH